MYQSSASGGRLSCVRLLTGPHGAATFGRLWLPWMDLHPADGVIRFPGGKGMSHLVPHHEQRGALRPGHQRPLLEDLPQLGPRCHRPDPHHSDHPGRRDARGWRPTTTRRAGEPPLRRSTWSPTTPSAALSTSPPPTRAATATQPREGQSATPKVVRPPGIPGWLRRPSGVLLGLSTIAGSVTGLATWQGWEPLLT